MTAALQTGTSRASEDIDQQVNLVCQRIQSSHGYRIIRLKMTGTNDPHETCHFI